MGIKTPMTLRARALAVASERRFHACSRKKFPSGRAGNWTNPIPQPGGLPWARDSWSIKGTECRRKARRVQGAGNNVSAQTAELAWDRDRCLISVSADHSSHLDPLRHFGRHRRCSRRRTPTSRQARRLAHAPHRATIQRVSAPTNHRENQTNDLYFIQPSGAGNESVAALRRSTYSLYAAFGR